MLWAVALLAPACAGSDGGPGGDDAPADSVAVADGVTRGHGEGVADGVAVGDSAAGTDGGAPTDSTGQGDSVAVVFTREEAPVRLWRPVPASSADLRTALEWLVRGPTAEERARGIRSWFSGETAGALKSVEIGPTGRAVVEFHDLRPLIPGASSSAGSAMLLDQLNRTVFHFPGVRSVEYRMDGSCAAFWEWLQYECRIVPRPANGGDG